MALQQWLYEVISGPDGMYDKDDKLASGEEFTTLPDLSHPRFLDGNVLASTMRQVDRAAADEVARRAVEIFLRESGRTHKDGGRSRKPRRLKKFAGEYLVRVRKQGATAYTPVSVTAELSLSFTTPTDEY